MDLLRKPRVAECRVNVLCVTPDDDSGTKPPKKLVAERALSTFERIDKLLPGTAADALTRHFAAQERIRHAALGGFATEFAQLLGRRDLAMFGPGSPFVQMSRTWREALPRLTLESPLQGLGATLTAYMEEQTKALRGIADVSSAFREQMEKLAGPVALMREQTRAFSGLADLMKPLARTALADLEKELARATLPSAAMLGWTGDRRAAVLTGLESDSGFGALSWLDSNDVGSSVRSAMLRAPPPKLEPTRQTISIHAAIACALCEGLLYVPSHSVEVVSEREVDLRLSVLPVCPKCREQLGDDYFLEQLRNLRRPRLELIPGDGQDPVARDRQHLRLVERAPDDEDDT